MRSFVRRLKFRSWCLKALPFGMLVLFLGGGGRAQNYVNNGTVVNQPNFTATNFLNGVNGVFSVTQTPLSQNWQNYLYQGWGGTVNFTNKGSMDAVSGFRFDTKGSITHSEAGSFYNAGNIDCGGSSLLFYNNYSFNGLLYGYGYGGIYVWATNIYNSGTIAIQADGFAQFNGDNIEFTHSAAVNLSQTSVFGYGFANLTATGQTDNNTNDWSATDLQPTYASAPLNTTPYQIFLFNSVPYFKIFPPDETGTNVAVRMVFLEDNSVDVIATNVYFGANLNNNADVVEWIGTYIDPATGQSATRYLYLADTGVSTNILKYGDPGTGVPPNFSFFTSNTPQTPGTPAVSGYVNGLFSGDNVTNNIYSYVDAQFIATTVATSDGYYPIALTNLPGRIEINAAKNLNFSVSSLTGMNYLKLNSTNQFDTDGHSQYASPYSDLYLGHTNGTMTVSNLVQSYVPTWSGSCEAYSTSFTNSLNGTNYTYRVLLVSSQLNPISLAQIQDFVLYSSNNVVISDKLNVTRTLFLDCTNLLITTNGVGVGAASLQGELNLLSTNTTWNAAFPRLLCLTNMGAIQYSDAAQFMSRSNALSVIPGASALSATGMLSGILPSVNVVANNQVIIGTSIYTFVASLTSTPNQVKIGTGLDSSLSNLVAAINHDAGAGSKYSSGTSANLQVTAGPLVNHGFTVTAIVPGSAGNTNQVFNINNATNLTWNGYTTLHGGADATSPVTNSTPVMVPYHNFYNSGLVSGPGANIWSDTFENYGLISAGTNSFAVDSQTTTMTNGVVLTGGTFSDMADSTVISGTTIQAGKSLTLIATNLLTDNGVGSTNYWSLGTGFSGYGFADGLVLPIKPAAGDLLGTIIDMTAVTNATAPGATVLTSIWAGLDRGNSVTGFNNNAAIGKLILNAQAQSPQCGFYFTGTGGSNAIYVDCLQLENYASYTNRVGLALPTLSFDPNVVIYYAQAITEDGVSVAQKINGYNNNHLRWVPAYAGHFSSVNIVYPDGTTNAVNAALAQANNIDSDGDGIVNNVDPTPVFVPSQVKFAVSLTNLPPLSVKIQWKTIPLATNYIEYTTNLAVPSWLPFTNFDNYYYGANVAVPNPAHLNYFVSPQPYFSPSTNVWVFDPVTNVPHYYRVFVQPVYP